MINNKDHENSSNFIGTQAGDVSGSQLLTEGLSPVKAKEETMGFQGNSVACAVVQINIVP